MAESVKKDSMPSPSNSSGNNDNEFTVSAEMMVDAEDFENTLDEEEQMDAGDDEDELNDLQKEGDMPLEELLAMYYGNVPAENTNNIEPVNTDIQSIKEGKSMPDESSNFSEQTGNYNEDEYDPFQNQRITRGSAALNSKYFDVDYSSDEDYQPTADDWKKDIQIGDDFQAVVDNDISHYKPDERTYDVDDKLLWKPEIVSQESLKRYLDIVYKLTDANNAPTSNRDDEQVLFTLLQTKHVDKALAKCQERHPPDVSLWSEEECQNFEQGLRVFGKDFRLIQKNKMVTRTVGEIVQFYYLWKKTERRDAFVVQTKIGGRKRNPIPGMIDMFGGGESVFSSRSASPSNMESNDINYSNHNNIADNHVARIKSELTEPNNERKQDNNYNENSYTNYTNNDSYFASQFHSSYDNAYRNDRTILMTPNNTTNNSSWRTSPKSLASRN